MTAIAGLSALILSGCGENPKGELVKISGSTMGTYYRVTAAAIPGGPTEEKIQAAVAQRLEEINALMSTYLPDSEVSRFNQSSQTDWFSVAPETAQVVQAALDIFQQSKGAFDITVGPLVDLWGFGPGESTGQVPDEAAIEAARNQIGSQHLEVRLSPPAIKKNIGDLRIDLSAIAKGYAVDSVAEALNNLGLQNHLVDIGGEMRATGTKSPSVRWTIAIESPTSDQQGIQQMLHLKDSTIATSGDYRNFFDANEARYSHEIDPQTGRPVTHTLASVSVIGDSCMLADAWATALIVLGPKKGMELSEQAGLAAFFVIRDSAGFREVANSEYQQRFPQTGKRE